VRKAGGVPVSAPAWTTFDRDGVRLACLDFGGQGPSALLLHGLAGHAGEWAETASWLTQSHRVLALDCRGHGRSERAPVDVSRAAHVADVVFAIEQLEIGPVVLAGQSLGGHLAILVAARHPTLVRALVVAEASPAGAGAKGAAALAAEVGASLARWPVPFASREAAVTFFGGPSVCADAWAAGLERHEDGWWPAFDVEVMARTLREGVADDQWEQWRRIRCPTLVVRGASGTLELADAEAMVRQLPGARRVEIAGAGHDVHLDRPAAWREAVWDFLGSLNGA
jgi:pimeloyl-ACP methyl ester carboxylesterase